MSDLISADLRRRRRIMNHDYAHCLDYSVDCPKECFRGHLVKDLKSSNQCMAVSWMSFEGTEECMKEKDHEQIH